MPRFADLQKNVRNLPEKLAKYCATQYFSRGRLFCGLPQLTNTHLFTRIIRQRILCFNLSQRFFKRILLLLDMPLSINPWLR